MKNRHEYDDALAAEYAVGTLRGGARLHFEQRLQTERALAEKVAKWQTMLLSLDRNLVPVTPPERVWKKIALSMPHKTTQPRWKTNTLSWALAAGIGLLSVTSWYYLRTPELTPLVVLSGAQQGEWVVSTDSDRKLVRITALTPVSLDQSKSFQLWMIPAGHQPISIGLVNVKGTSEFELPASKLPANGIIAISLEPHGGSPTGQPTGPVVYSGQLKI